jgi:hypothetical protein
MYFLFIYLLLDSTTEGLSKYIVFIVLKQCSFYHLFASFKMY